MRDADDARLPVIFAPAAEAGPEDALLLDAGAPDAPGAGHVARLAAGRAALHAAGCACCLPRDAAAEALGRLFLARARGEAPAFRRLVVDIAAPEAVREALRGDRLAAGRFRLATSLPR